MKMLIGVAMSVLIASTSYAGAAGSSDYSVTFNASWTKQSHPIDYPDNAHLSGLIGATHSSNYTIFSDGMEATDGLEALTESGSHSPLDKEIDKAIAAGSAGAKFESGPLFEFPGKISAKFTATARHPFVSVAAMIAPSPDWFTGVSKVSLKKNGKWVDTITMPLLAWDAGSDHGLSYKAPDANASPRQSVRLNAAPHFASQQGVRQVGTVTFTRIINATN